MRSHGGLSIGNWEGEEGGKVQGIKSVTGKHKIYRDKLRIV